MDLYQICQDWVLPLLFFLYGFTLPRTLVTSRTMIRLRWVFLVTALVLAVLFLIWGQYLRIIPLMVFVAVYLYLLYVSNDE